MKRLTMIASIMLLALAFPAILSAQIAVVQTSHMNPDSELTGKEWMEIEKKYHEEVVMKNEYIRNSAVLFHYFTPDNTEILFITVYDSMESIPLAGERTGELIEAAWPDKEERQDIMWKRLGAYTQEHSDEIYSMLPNAKGLADDLPDTSRVYYMRKGRLAMPSREGSGEEAAATMKEMAENVHHKNESVLAYYPMRHFYGADSRDLIEFFVVESLADVATMNENTQELVQAYWSDEEERKAFFDKMGKYVDAWHGDFLYTSVAPLMK